MFKRLFLFLPIVILFFVSCGKEEKKEVTEEVKKTDKIFYDIAFSRDEKIIVMKMDKSLIDSSLNGSDPCLSPDGKKIAYTNYEGKNRKVVIYDFNTKLTQPVNVPNDNNFGAMWSPDSYLIALSLFVNKKWVVGVVNQENSIFKYISDKLPNGAYSPTWTWDSKRIVTHDLDKIYILDLDGNILSTYDINEIAEGNSVSSATKFLLTPDEKSIIYTAGVDEDADFDEPPEALFRYDIAAKKNTRLTAKGIYAVYPSLRDNNIIFFAASKSMDEPWSIYSIPATGGNPQLVIKDGTYPSLSINK